MGTCGLLSAPYLIGAWWTWGNHWTLYSINKLLVACVITTHHSIRSLPGDNLLMTIKFYIQLCYLSLILRSNPKIYVNLASNGLTGPQSLIWGITLYCMTNYIAIRDESNKQYQVIKIHKIRCLLGISHIW